MTAPAARTRKPPTPMCPLRPEEPCYLCVPGATGPQDCPTVALVMSDPELRQLWREKRAEQAARARGES